MEYNKARVRQQWTARLIGNSRNRLAYESSMPDELREDIPSLDRSETTLEEGSQVVFDPRVFLTSTPSFVKKRK